MVLIIPYFICNFYNFVYEIIRNYILKDSFKFDTFRIIPLDEKASYLKFVYGFCSIFPLLSNFLSFYFSIRDTYKEKKRIECLNINDDFVKISIKAENNEIDDFLN